MTPPPDRDDTNAATGKPMSPAERMRRHYRRAREKKQSLRVDLTKEYLDQIVRDGWIAAEQVTDPEILGSVIEDRDDSRKLGNFEAGPICTTGTATS